MKRLVLDIDGTLTAGKTADASYADVEVRDEIVASLKAYRAEGFEIILHTSRGMRSYKNSVGHLNVHMLPTLLAWLDRHEIPYDEIHVGKPWCGHDGFYVDDRAVRPSEFIKLNFREIADLLEKERMEAAQNKPPLHERASPDD